MTRGKDSAVGEPGAATVPCNSPTGHPQSHRRAHIHKMSVNFQPTPHPRHMPSHTLLQDIARSTTTQVQASVSFLLILEPPI